ncbi:ABC transporter permease [Thermoanaerobacterium thermosaccharolyticum]|jgi:putative aldouronate transport system permease protein|uniref:ABC transporter permease n=1 Tax=Thermoanaerobacterium thermosaccharolyticum TaxID=1517 RepID=UPI001784775E|nr:ABC transporter permease subunit [Thermoanaerobacterium thermosaccharolyticum]MBE0069643.1 sugar ABC transporter permease [Thermoanaerobacterium thermosaccharolyticum]MBE0229342.1 sugar ABC transporter permease [Thermoanaerobacterium thermosaccharolyticum]
MNELLQIGKESKINNREVTPYKSKISYIRNHYIIYLLLMPAVILTFIFKYIPMYGIVLAFKDYSYSKGILGSAWVGFKYFEQFLNSPNFGTIFMNTFLLSAYGLILGFPVPIILAIMLNQVQKAKIKKTIQLILYAPNFISVVVVVGMLYLLLSSEGPINRVVMLITGHPILFMSDPQYFRSIYILSGIWQGAGWSSIVYAAALAGVDTELYDAARIDGATLLQRIWYIEIPTIKPVIVITLILAIGGIMGIGFEKAYLMQTGMNTSVSEIIATYTYKVGLQGGDYSFGTAVGLFNSLINLVLLISANSIAKLLNEGYGLY